MTAEADCPPLQQGASELLMLKGKCQLWLPSSPSPQAHYKIFVYRCALFLSCKPISQGQRREAGSVITSGGLHYNTTVHSDLSGMMVSLRQFTGTSHTRHDKPDFHLSFPKITHWKTDFDEGSSRHNLARTEPNSSYEGFRIALPKGRLSNGTPKNLPSRKASFSQKKRWHCRAFAHFPNPLEQRQCCCLLSCQDKSRSMHQISSRGSSIISRVINHQNGNKRNKSKVDCLNKILFYKKPDSPDLWSGTTFL